MTIANDAITERQAMVAWAWIQIEPGDPDSAITTPPQRSIIRAMRGDSDRALETIEQKWAALSESERMHWRGAISRAMDVWYGSPVVVGIETNSGMLPDPEAGVWNGADIGLPLDPTNRATDRPHVSTAIHFGEEKIVGQFGMRKRRVRRT